MRVLSQSYTYYNNSTSIYTYNHIVMVPYGDGIWPTTAQRKRSILVPHYVKVTKYDDEFSLPLEPVLSI